MTAAARTAEPAQHNEHRFAYAMHCIEQFLRETEAQVGWAQWSAYAVSGEWA